MNFDSGTSDVQKMEKEKDVEGLIKALGYEKDWHVREYAVRAFGEISDNRTVEPLIRQLSDNDKDVRKKAARTLVLLYNGRGADQRTKQAILAVRATITKSHVDRSWVSSTDCTSGHNDTGIGESFPL